MKYLNIIYIHSEYVIVHFKYVSNFYDKTHMILNVLKIIYSQNEIK